MISDVIEREVRERVRLCRERYNKAFKENASANTLWDMSRATDQALADLDIYIENRRIARRNTRTIRG